MPMYHALEINRKAQRPGDCSHCARRLDVLATSQRSLRSNFRGRRVAEPLIVCACEMQCAQPPNPFSRELDGRVANLTRFCPLSHIAVPARMQSSS